MIALFEINAGVLMLILLIIINSVCDRSINLKEKSALFFVWFFSFLPFVLIPIEISELILTPSIRQMEFDRKIFKGIWLAYYWVNFFNGWILLPIWLGYYLSGYFTFRNRLLDSFRFNILFYVYSVGIVCMAWVALTINYKRDVWALVGESLLIYYSVLADQLLHRVPGLAELRPLPAANAVFEGQKR